MQTPATHAFPEQFFADTVRLKRLIDYVETHSSRAILATLLGPRSENGMTDPLWNRFHFDHCAIMQFPESAATLHAELTDAGFHVGPTIPSVVVQQRICTRYGLDPHRYPIHLLRAHRPARRSTTEVRLEIFFPTECTPSSTEPHTAEQHEHLRHDERVHSRETHFAFTVDDFDLHTYRALRHHLTNHASMLPDDGGFNPHERVHGDGCSTFYFIGPERPGRHWWPRRLELICGGRHDTALTEHRTANHRQPRPMPSSHPR